MMSRAIITGSDDVSNAVCALYWVIKMWYVCRLLVSNIRLQDTTSPPDVELSSIVLWLTFT